MKLSQLLQISPSLQVLSTLKLPAKASFRIAKIVNLIKPDLAAHDVARTALLQELGTIDETGTSYNLTAVNSMKFGSAMAQLADEECDLVLPTLAISDLGDIEIEPLHLAALGELITDDTETPVFIPVP